MFLFVLFSKHWGAGTQAEAQEQGRNYDTHKRVPFLIRGSPGDPDRKRDFIVQQNSVEKPVIYCMGKGKNFAGERKKDLPGSGKIFLKRTDEVSPKEKKLSLGELGSATGTLQTVLQSSER